MTDNNLSQNEADTLRNQMINDNITPFIEDNFSKFPWIQAATLFVAQYWNDEAEDAVHYEVLWSQLTEPPFNRGTFPPDFNVWDPDPTNLPTGMHSSHQHGYVAQWDSNGIAIPLFAAYCKEDCHQEMDFAECYSPLIEFTRASDGSIERKFVGSKIRPWLDGVRGQY